MKKFIRREHKSIIFWISLIITTIALKDVKLIDTLGKGLSIIGMPIAVSLRFLSLKIFKYDLPRSNEHIAAVIVSALIIVLFAFGIYKFLERIIVEEKKSEVRLFENNNKDEHKK